MPECNIFTLYAEPCAIECAIEQEIDYNNSMFTEQNIRAVLLDLDGVLYVGDLMIEGADTSIHRLRERGLKLAGLTNTTTQSRRMIADKLSRLGIDLSEDDLYTPAALAVPYIGQSPVRLYIRDALREDFSHVYEAEEYENEKYENEEHPEFIVMGDIGGEGYPPEILREIFQHMMDGAKLLALHKNRFWQKPDGLHLDLGTFVAAIEYATGKEATILGKPSADFFVGVCKALDVRPEQALMVGDDIESDILGAHRAGLKTALVHTGKYRKDFVEQIMRLHDFSPTMQLDSIACLTDD